MMFTYQNWACSVWFSICNIFPLVCRVQKKTKGVVTDEGRVEKGLFYIL